MKPPAVNLPMPMQAFYALPWPTSRRKVWPTIRLREKRRFGITTETDTRHRRFAGKTKKPGQKLVGFALETNDERQNAQGKLERKNFDFIVLNSLNDKGAGFRCDTNKITIIDRQGYTDYPLKSKREVACDIIDKLVRN